MAQILAITERIRTKKCANQYAHTTTESIPEQSSLQKNFGGMGDLRIHHRRPRKYEAECKEAFQ
jgi:hypothetical protein